MRAIVLVFLLAACSGASATIGDSTGGNDESSGDKSSSGGGSSGATAGCPSTKSASTNAGGPPPPPRSRVVFDVVNKGGVPLYIVNDDSEREMLEVSSGGTALRLTAPPVTVCGSTLKPNHPSRFLYAVAPGETRTVGGWDKRIIADGGKVCVDCKAQGRPELGVELVAQYSSVDAAPGTYTAAVKILTALPAGCTPAALGFHCASWPGAAALAGSTRSSKVSVSVGDEPVGGADQHVTVTF